MVENPTGEEGTFIPSPSPMHGHGCMQQGRLHLGMLRQSSGSDVVAVQVSGYGVVAIELLLWLQSNHRNHSQGLLEAMS